MKVLHAIYSLDPQMGGTVEALLQLVAASRESDQQHEIVCLDAPDAISRFGHSETIYACGPTQHFYGNSSRLKAWLGKNISNYDMAVIHGCWQYHGLAVFRACRRNKIPYIQYPHGMLDPWFKRQYPLKHLKKWLYWPWGEYRILKYAKKVIFTSEEERDLAKQSFWLYQVNPSIIPLGITPPPYNLKDCKSKWETAHPEFEKKRILLYLSRIHEKKGVDMLIEAVNRLNQKSTNTQNVQSITLIIAGPCEDATYLKTLQSRASEIDLSGPIEAIQWFGMVKDKMKWGLLARAEAFILPSHQENFGMVVAESLACSTPVLLSNKVNIWKEILSDNAGLVEKDDLNGTVQLISKWISISTDEQKTYQRNALACFNENFMMETNAKRLFELIETQIPSQP